MTPRIIFMLAVTAIRPIRKMVKPFKRKYRTWRVRSRAAQVGVGLRVNRRSTVNKQTFLGDNVNFNGMKIAGSGAVHIGNNFHSGEDCLLITQIHDYDHGDAIPYGNTYVIRPITIEDNVWLGSRVIILGGVTIGEGAIIQAGSCVVSDIPKYGIAGGHPAKVFKERDIEHYEKLKAEQRFK